MFLGGLMRIYALLSPWIHLFWPPLLSLHQRQCWNGADTHVIPCTWASTTGLSPSPNFDWWGSHSLGLYVHRPQYSVTLKSWIKCETWLNRTPYPTDTEACVNWAHVTGFHLLLLKVPPISTSRRMWASSCHVEKEIHPLTDFATLFGVSFVAFGVWCHISVELQTRARKNCCF